ncbi:MAG: hypothetical protein ACXWMJ_00665, partial [Syntrophales bacterium]
MKRRVVITSMGIISSLGCNHGEIVKSFKERKVNFERPPFDDEVVTSPIENFSVRDYTGPFKPPKAAANIKTSLALLPQSRPRRLAWPRTSPFHGANAG